MLLSGQLRYTGVSVTEAVTRSTVTGASKKTLTEGASFRFARHTHKEQRAMLGKEEGYKGSIILRCRKGPATTAMTHFRYDGNLYRIEQKLPDPHNYYDITATLVNE